MIILGGTSHPEFVDLICRSLCHSRGDVCVAKFANGEIKIDIGVSVRDQDVFIIQTGHGKVNDLMTELMIMVHACKISSARRVIVVIPHFPYAKMTSLSQANLKHEPSLGPRRRSLPKNQKPYEFDSLDGINPEYQAWPVQTNTLIANMIQTSGADHFITMDLHDPQFQGFFDVPLENLQSLPLMAKCIKGIPATFEDTVIVSPDAGGAKRTAQLAEVLGFDFALVHQDRRTGSSSDTSMLIGNVKDRLAIIMDDMIDTSETLINAAELLQERGAKKIISIVTHGIFSGNAIENLHESCIETVYVSNSIPQKRALEFGPKFQTFDVSCMFAEAIRRLHNGESFSYLFKPDAFH